MVVGIDYQLDRIQNHLEGVSRKDDLSLGCSVGVWRVILIGLSEVGTPTWNVGSPEPFTPGLKAEGNGVLAFGALCSSAVDGM